MKKQLLSSSSLKPATNESGRSMVEMLGVLAIIGVLSIGGVAGYGRAINAHRANTAIETAQREAMIVAGEIATGQKVEPGSATVLRASTGYEVAVKDVTGGTTDITNTTPFFGVEVGGGSGQPVQRNVAKSVVERAVEDWTNIHGIGVISGEGEGRTIKWLKSAGTGANGFETEVSESAQTVILIIVYASDLAPRTGDLLTDFNVTPVDPNACNPPCNSCRLCYEGQCVVDDDKDGVQECTTANNEEGICNAGECVPTLTDNCPSGTTVEEGYTGTDALADGKCICTSFTENQCGNGYYCWVYSFSTGVGVVKALCKPVEDRGPEGISQGHYYSTKTTDWRSANSWCIGMGSSGLISVSTLSTLSGTSIALWYNNTTSHPLYNAFCGNSTPSSCLPDGKYWVKEQETEKTKCFVSLDSTQERVSSQGSMLKGYSLCE